ncbi:MAG TPA: DUF1016 N-terminal domain-containing protein [Burkholderiaceae bacterium]
MSSRTAPAVPSSSSGIEVEAPSFAEVVGLILRARQRAYQAVNSELVELYWEIGRYISAKLETAAWGEGVVQRLAEHLARTLPGQRGFTRRNLFRMRQFFDTYRDDEKVRALLTQLPWTHHLAILGDARGPRSASSTCASPSGRSGAAGSSTARSGWALSSAPCSIGQRCQRR